MPQRKIFQDFIDDKVPQNFIPGWSTPSPPDRNFHQTNCLPQSKRSFIQTGKDLIRARFVSLNQSCKDQKNGGCHNLKKTDSKKCLANACYEKNFERKKEMNSSDNLKRQSCSMNELSNFADLCNLDDLSIKKSFKLQKTTSEDNPKVPKSATTTPKLPKAFKPTNNMSLLHPDIFVSSLPTRRKTSNWSRSYSLVSNNLFANPSDKILLRTRSQSMTSDQDIENFKQKLLSEKSLRSQPFLAPPLDNSKDNFLAASLEQTASFSKVDVSHENTSPLRPEKTIEKCFLKIPISQCFNAIDSNSNKKPTQHELKNLNDTPSLSPSAVTVVQHRPYSGLQLNLDLNKTSNTDVIKTDACVSTPIKFHLEEVDVKLTDKKLISKFEVENKSTDYRSEHNLYRPRSQSLRVKIDSDENDNMPQNDTLRRRSWSSDGFLKATSMLELNCRKVKVISTERFFATQTNSCQMSDDDRNNFSVKLRAKRKESFSKERRRRISFSESSIFNAFKKMDEENHRLSKSFFNDSGNERDDKTKKIIENAMRSKLPKTFQATVIDPFSVQERRLIKKKSTKLERDTDSNNKKDFRSRSPSLAIFQSSPKGLRKLRNKTSSVDSENTNSLIVDSPKVDSPRVDSPTTAIRKSIKWQIPRLKERQTSESSEVEILSCTPVFQRALRYTNSCDEYSSPDEDLSSEKNKKSIFLKKTSTVDKTLTFDKTSTVVALVNKRSDDVIPSSNKTNALTLKQIAQINEKNIQTINEKNEPRSQNLSEKKQVCEPNLGHEKNVSCSEDVRTQNLVEIRSADHFSVNCVSTEHAQNKNESCSQIKMKEFSESSDASFICKPSQSSSISVMKQTACNSSVQINQVYKSQFSYTLRHSVSSHKNLISLNCSSFM